MFVRTLRRKHTDNVVVQIVRSFRNDDGKPRQELIRSLGSAPPGPALDALLALAEVEKQQILSQQSPALFPSEVIADGIIAARQRKEAGRPLPIADARQLEGEDIVKLGVHEVFGRMYDELGLDAIWPARQAVSARVFRQAVLARLALPGRSKRGQVKRLSDYGVELPLDRVYRMMDQLNGFKERDLSAHLDGVVRGLLGTAVEVVFVDATTVAFATEAEDGLRRRGFSKDGRPHRSQVVLALLQTREGLPVGYRLFPGNTAEVKTLAPAVEELRSRYRVGRMVLVGDAGLFSADNLAQMEEANLDWVVAARLRSMGRKDFESLGSWEDWPAQEADAKGRVRRMISRTIGGRRLVVRYCPRHARRSVRLRDKAVERAKVRLKNARPGKFLTLATGSLRLNREAIQRDAQYDGLHAVWTSLSEAEASDAQVRTHYAELWRIEQGFRVMKHTLKLRPVFHWTERRVRAHILICYTAFALMRLLRYRYLQQHSTQAPLSEDRILEELDRVRVSIVRDHSSRRRFVLPFPPNREQTLLYRTVGLTLRRSTVLLSSPKKPRP